MSFGKHISWTDETERILAKQLKGFIPSEIFQDGLELFVNGYVQEWDWDNETTFSGKIGGSSNVCKSTVSFQFLPFSRCSCGSKGSCSHLAAMICAALYARDIPVLEFLRKYKLASVDESDIATNDLAGARKQTSAAIEAVNVKRDAPERTDSAGAVQWMPDAIPQSESNIPRPQDGYRKWQRIFENRMPKYTYSFSEYDKWVDHHLLRPSVRWEEGPVKAAYRIHALLYALKLADRTFRFSFNERYVGAERSIGWLISELTAGLIAFQSEFKGASPEDSSSLADGIFHVVGDYLADAQTFVYEWAEVYRGVWGRIPVHSEALHRERERIQHLAEQSQKPYFEEKTVLRTAHLEQLVHGPEASTAYILRHWHGKPDIFYSYLEAYKRSGNWPFLQVWLQSLAELVSRYGDSEDVRTLIRYWEPMADATLHRKEKAKEKSLYLQRMLPTSFPIYTATLLELQDYRAWVDVHLACEVFPDASEGYWFVERNAPELLLPAYHRFIESWIQERKRESYRYAVPYLKKLKGLYEKINKKERWADYMDKLVVRHSRLKALHEELRKGRLLPK